MPQHYIDELKAWNGTNYLSRSISNPAEIVVPFVRLLFNKVAQNLEKCKSKTFDALDPNLEEFWDETLQAEEEIHFDAFIYVEQISQSLKSLRHFMALHQRTPSPIFRDTIDDIAILLEDAIRLRDALKDRLGR